MVMIILKKTNLTAKTIKEISKIKNEPKWMTEFRLKSYEKFLELHNPNFGPELKIDFSDINYYKRIDDKVHNTWEDVPKEARNTFKEIGLPDAEAKYLAGIGAQFESEVIYHNMLKELVDKNVIFCDTDTALKEYPELFKKYFKWCCVEWWNVYLYPS